MGLVPPLSDFRGRSLTGDMQGSLVGIVLGWDEIKKGYSCFMVRRNESSTQQPGYVL